MSADAATKGHDTAAAHACAAPVMLDAHDLPAFCPNKTMALWNQHPKVFLDVATTGAAMCPYCGTQYRLKGGAAQHGH